MSEWYFYYLVLELWYGITNGINICSDHESKVTSPCQNRRKMNIVELDVCNDREPSYVTKGKVTGYIHSLNFQLIHNLNVTKNEIITIRLNILSEEFIDL